MDTPLSDEAALALADAPAAELPALLDAASAVRDRAWGRTVTFSPKVFLPITNLCRNRCDYCSFRRSPGDVGAWTMTPVEVGDWLDRGLAQGCAEALFCLGDKPETAFSAYRTELQRLGQESTVEYLYWAGRAALDRGLLPHTNAGILTAEDMVRLKEVNVSLGLMLESVSARLCQPGMPHHRAPDKRPERRMKMLEEAGQLRVPFTTGILIGIGETRRERIESLLWIRGVHRAHRHIQEVIVQRFRARPDIPMASAPEPDDEELFHAVAMARLILDADVSVQAPPNLMDPDGAALLLKAGINDFGGISPVTPDYINPRHPWPHLDALAARCAELGYTLAPRLPIYDRYVDREGFLAEGLREATERAGARIAALAPQDLLMNNAPDLASAGAETRAILEACLEGRDLAVEHAVTLFGAKGRDLDALRLTADALRREQVGDTVAYVVNRNINFTNVCVKACTFCAFARNHRSEKGYFLDQAEVVRRALEARDLGATEVCIQAGLAPGVDGRIYIDLCRAVKAAAPELHLHAFSPEEVKYGAELTGVPIRAYLEELKEAGLGSLPGTSAEVLDDAVRAAIAPGRISTAEWIEVITTAHALGLPTTSTLMFGHIEGDAERARHLDLLRSIQRETGGFTELVPLSFVHREAPMYLKGLVPGVRPGPTSDDVIRLFAVARLMIGGTIKNLQASWVKEGIAQATELLSCGANDLGGTLLNESISTAAGAPHGQFMSPRALRDAIRAAGREPLQRDTRYRALRRFARVAGPGEEAEEPLDRIEDAAAAFGTYASTSREERFRFKRGPLQP